MDAREYEEANIAIKAP